MKKTIVFILTTLDAHAVHRVNDFVDHGFDVQVNTFVRSNARQSIHPQWPVNVVGEFPNALPYYKRIAIIIKGIRKVEQIFHGKDNVFFYYLGLDIAMFATGLVHHPYIYEECDLNHTYIGNPKLRALMEIIDLRIIRKSLQTIFTSEGFFKFHQLKSTDNITLIPNKLPSSLIQIDSLPDRQVDVSHLSFGFAGDVRYENIVSFAKIVVTRFPQHEFHFFGTLQERVKKQASELERYPNCHFHGRFRSPDDLPTIYSQIDFTLATYDTRFENVRYAEPNKIYEAVYFRTPIIVSKGTFLQEKCESLGIGCAVDALSESDVVSFIRSLTSSKLSEMYSSVAKIPQSYAIDDNEKFFEKLLRL